MENNDPLLESKHVLVGQIKNILITSGKALTKALREEKKSALERFRLWYGQQDPAPTRLTTKLAFYKDYIDNRNYSTIVNAFINNLQSDADRKILQTTKGREKVTNLIKEKLWKHIKGKFARARDPEARLTDSESDDGNDEPSTPRSSSPPPQETLTPRKRTSSDIVLVVPVPKRSKPARRSMPTIDIPPGVDIDDDPALRVITEDDAPSFSFALEDTDGLVLKEQDMNFTWQSVSLKTAMILMTVAQAKDVPVTMLKCLIMLTSSSRYNLLSAALAETYWTIAAPLLDAHTRLYTLLIDLSLTYRTRVAPREAVHKFKVFFFILVCYGYERVAHFPAFWKQLSVFKIAPNIPKKKLLSSVANVSTNTLHNECLAVVTYLASIMDCRDQASFSLSNDLSAKIEATQQSLSPYETVLLHLISNSLLDSKRNTSYGQTMALFKAIFCNEQNDLTRTQFYKTTLAKALEQCL